MSGARPQRPERAAMAVLRSILLGPPPVEAEKVAEPFRLRVERMMEECRIRRGQGPHAPGFILLQLVEHQRENERPRIVVRAVPLGKIWHGENGVLKNSRRV